MFGEVPHHRIKYIHIYNAFVISSLSIYDNICLLSYWGRDKTLHKSMKVEDEGKGPVRSKGIQSSHMGIAVAFSCQKEYFEAPNETVS